MEPHIYTLFPVAACRCFRFLVNHCTSLFRHRTWTQTSTSLTSPSRPAPHPLKSALPVRVIACLDHELAPCSRSSEPPNVSHAAADVLSLPWWQPFHYHQENNCLITQEAICWTTATTTVAAPRQIGFYRLFIRPHSSSTSSGPRGICHPVAQWECWPSWRASA